MHRYTVRYFDHDRAGVFEEAAHAASEQELRERYGRDGRVLLGLRMNPGRRGVVRTRGGALDVSVWCRELRTLLVAGMTIPEALETLHAQSHGGVRGEVHATLIRALQEGQSLSRAMAGSGRFPTVLIASVKASERTSTLATALEDYLSYDELLSKLKRQVVSAALYPAVVATLGLLVTAFLLAYVIPRFSRMYMTFKGAVSGPTRALLWVSDALQTQLPLLVLGVTALVAGAWWLLRTGRLTELGVWLVAGIAPLRRGFEHFSRAKLYQSLALMFKGGYPLDEALAVCSDLGLGREGARGIASAQAGIARGQAVSAAFAAGDLADPVDERLLAVGERSGGFGKVLDAIAQRHAEDFETFVGRLTRLVEPVMLLIVSLVVGGIVVMMYMPIFDIAGGAR